MRLSVRAGTHVLLAHHGDPSKRPLLGSERSLELQHLRLAGLGKEGVGMAILDRVQARADQGLVDFCLPDLDLVDFCLRANRQEANGIRAG